MGLVLPTAAGNSAIRRLKHWPDRMALVRSQLLRRATAAKRILVFLSRRTTAQALRWISKLLQHLRSFASSWPWKSRWIESGSIPPIVPGNGAEERVKHWQEWVAFVRERPGQYDEVDGERIFWADHLYLGWETHKELRRQSRAFGKKADFFSDGLEYEEVADLRTWFETKPAPFLVHEGILAEHSYFCGPTGAGKTTLGIIPLLMQIIRGWRKASGELSEGVSVVFFDFKGDRVCLETLRQEAKARGQTFRFFTTEVGTATYRYNPFRGFDRSLRTINQLCQLLLDALSLNHGRGYGRSYYTERSRHLLSLTLKRYPNVGSFEELYAALKSIVAGMKDRAKTDAFELLSVIEMLTEYRQLITSPDEDLSNVENVIFMPRVIRDREIVYFWLPAALESISMAVFAKLALFNLRIAAQDWKRFHPEDPRRIILVADEAQHLVGENIRGILQDARSFGISAILANQSLRDLRTPSGLDLAPAIMTNARLKLFFKTPSETECYAYVERGKGFTAARQYPERDNPFLRDLAPEEFGYHVRLWWPFSYDEYKRREVAPMPTWDDIPGGNFLAERKAPQALPIDDDDEAADVLPHAFTLLRDDAWRKQLALVRGLFSDEDKYRSCRDEVIGELLFDDDRDAEEEDAEEAE